MTESSARRQQKIKKGAAFGALGKAKSMFERTANTKRWLGAWIGLISLVLGGCGAPSDFSLDDDGELQPLEYEAAFEANELEEVRESEQSVVDGSHNTAPTAWAFQTRTISAPKHS